MESYRHGPLSFDVSDDGPDGGDVAVLLHGFPENRTSWSALTPYLVDAGYRVLAPDQRGYSPGARPLRRRDYRLPLLVSDVVALLDAVGAERVHLVGHDWGGAVAWAFAALQPQRLRSLSVLSTPHGRAMFRSMATSSQLLKSWYMFFFQLPWVPEFGLGYSLERLLTGQGLAAERVASYWQTLSTRQARRAAINWYRAMPLTSPSLVRLPVTAPTLYVYSTDDVALGRRAADLTGRYVSGPYRYEVLEGVSHWIPEEAPETVARLLLDHFAAS